MSEFGDGTYAQALLDAIKVEQRTAEASDDQTAAELARILAYMLEKWR